MKNEGKMVETEITFHNKTELKVQAQIYAGRTLVSTCVVGPGEIRTLPVQSERYDIFFKNGDTGWEIARILDSDANRFSLSQDNSRYTVHESRDRDPLDSVTKSDVVSNGQRKKVK